MLHFDMSFFQEAFDVNWRDWCFREKVQWSPYRLLRHDRVYLPIEDVLSKNRPEVERWHIAFLRGDENLYYQEYLHDDHAADSRDADKRAHKFRNLLIDVKQNGVLKSVWVAKVGDMLFRFDGCHRTCCAYVCGMETVPALVFKTEELK